MLYLRAFMNVAVNVTTTRSNDCRNMMSILMCNLSDDDLFHLICFLEQNVISVLSVAKSDEMRCGLASIVEFL